MFCVCTYVYMQAPKHTKPVHHRCSLFDVSILRCRRGVILHSTWPNTDSVAWCEAAVGTSYSDAALAI